MDAAARLAAGLLLGLTALILSSATALAAGPPTISATWVTDVTATSANLRAEINPEGLSTSYRLEYITEAAYRANLDAIPPREAFVGAVAVPVSPAAIGSGSSNVAVFQHLAALQPITTYHYRATAINSAKTVTGPEHTLTTEEPTSTFTLPDGRGWELVSPPDKGGGTVQGFAANFGGGVLQAAADGNAITYSSSSSFGAGAQGAPAASQYLSRRGEGAWSTENITGPSPSGGYGTEPDGVPFQLFSSDLASGLLLNPRRCGEGEECPLGYSLRDDSNGTLTPSPEAPGLHFAGATADLGHIVLSTCAALTPEATEVPGVGGTCVPAETNLYEWSGGALSLINEPAGHHARLAAQSGAISADGRRVYFTAGEDSPIFLYEEGQPTKFIAKTTGGVGSFQTASADGSLAFFTIAGDLYRYDALTETTSEPLAEEVKGVLGASEDGSYLYYETSTGLFVRHEGITTTTTLVAAEGAAGDYPPATGTARVSSDGTHLAFLSAASLTGYENLGDSEVYLYSADSNQLTCASCNPFGERPLGPSTIPGAIANGNGVGATDSYKPRDLSADGSRLFFDSNDRLAPQDTDKAPDVYEWEAQGTGACGRPGGCVGLISSGRSSEGASFIDAATDGSDAFFLTDGSLVPQDPGALDVYDAREGGGFPTPATAIPCEADACQSLPSAPEDPTPGTQIPGQGNPPVHFPKPTHKKAHHKKHKPAASHNRGGRK